MAWLKIANLVVGSTLAFHLRKTDDPHGDIVWLNLPVERERVRIELPIDEGEYMEVRIEITHAGYMPYNAAVLVGQRGFGVWYPRREPTGEVEFRREWAGVPYSGE